MKLNPMRLSRRSVLRGLLGGAAVSIGLPLFECMLDSTGTALASGGALPRRFAMFYWGNGVLPTRWLPTGEGDEWGLSEQLAPMADVKDDITVVSGMSVKVPNIEAHISGAAGLLSCAPLLSTDGHNTFRAPSIDQVIAAEIGGETRFKSLEFGAHAGGGMSFNGPDSQNPPETSPFALFERIFGAGFREPGSDAEVDPSIALRRSVLDAVLQDAARLQARLGTNDSTRLEQHMDSVRSLELSLARLAEDPPNLESCARPEEPLGDYPDVDGRPQLVAKNRAMVDICTMALACDQTRVASNFFTQSVDNVLFPDIPIGHHQLTHDEPGEQPQVHEIVLKIMTEAAYMIDAFRQIPEGDGTMLDNTALLCTSEISYGRTHSLDDMPLIIGGTARGFLKKGIHYRSHSSENATKVMLTLIRSMGIRMAEFGQDNAHVTESLSAIEA